jgi:protease-4
MHLGIKFRDVEGADDYGYSLNFGITLDGAGFHVLPRYNEEGNRRDEADGLRPVTYLVRLDPPYRGIPLGKAVRGAVGGDRYVELDFEKKSLTYQKARWFDDEKIAWTDLAADLEAIREDPGVRGVAINLAGFSARGTLYWEFRRKLLELRESGKEVVVHVDRAGLGHYYLASAADHLTLDPQGELVVAGIAAHRTYMKNLLEKLGIGFQELRYFKYKSAAETFSREDMSEADREQIGRAVDVIYETIREDVCEARGLTEEQFEAVVEDDPLPTAERAKARGLVDGIGRWHDLKEWLEEERSGATLGGMPFDRDRLVHPDERWGRPPEVALVYAIGPCAMESGIRGRETSEHLRKLAKNGNVAAVVLRADSPGGDALPSDLVAEGMEMNREEGHPVVVSQGTVAGSGGYWISMPGDRILTSPLTITGSIGVIGSWAWDEEFGEKTGFSADGVQRGSHSDLLAGGVRYPLIGRIPKRPLNDSELELAETLVNEMYDDFVGRVAKARGLEEPKVREVGQGRIWMGEDAIEHGLCDEVGTLPDAIEEAKRLAGLGPDEEIILSEFPPRKLFEFPQLGPSLLGSRLIARSLAGLFEEDLPATPLEDDDYATWYLRELVGSRGKPKLILPPGAYIEGWLDAP